MSDFTKKYLTTKIVVALSLIALTQVISFSFLYYVSYQQEGYAKLINISGRQRMLSQKLTLLTLEKRAGLSDNQTEFENLINLFMASHKRLIDPRQYSNESIPDEIAEHYLGNGALNRQVQMVESSYQEFFSGQGTNEDFQKFSAFVKGDFLKNLDSAVKLFEKRSDNLSQRLKIIQFITLAFGLLALGGVFYLIFRPLTLSVVKTERDLRKAKKVAEEQADFKAMFLANMSHELRTPLNGIIGVTDLMTSSPITEDQKERVMIIEECANTLLSIVNNILDLTKLEMGHMVLEDTPFNPRKLIDQQRYTFDYLVRSKGLSFKVSVSESLPDYLNGDATRVTQILNNLVGNAFKFTEDGFISLSSHYDGHNFILRVEDTGIGMSPEQKEKVFRPFTQADLSTTRKYGGTGLGLTITKEIISAMGGELQLDSEMGKGTSFTVTLPLPIAEPPETDSFERELLGQTKFAKILVVDDNEINCKMLSRLIERIGHEVDFAMTPMHTEELMKSNKYDLIFMDYHMPEMNGPELYLHLKEELRRELPPTIALTADLMDSTRKKIKEVGMKELVGKPIRKTQLRDLIDRYI